MQPILALQIDPLPTLHVDTDTSFALGLEAQKRGYRLFAYPPQNLSFHKGKVIARGHWVTFHDNTMDFYTLHEEIVLDLAEARFVLMRQNPPFDMAYIAATHLLELIPGPTRVLNDPAGVRNSPEKLLVTQFLDLMPPTLMSWDQSLMTEFIETHGSVILKPLFDFGGNGIFLLHPGDTNLTGMLEFYHAVYREPPILQRFLPEVALGDKRIILINGNPVGVFKRIPPKGQARSNMRLGGQAEVCDYTARDLEICDQIGPVLRTRGLILAGIDVIGDYLTEINVTSPTGMRVMNRLYDLDLAKTFWDSLEV